MKKNQTRDNTLLFVPTETMDVDREVVVFSEELVELGSKHWKSTLCGYFVGCNMSIGELRYNIRRMWGRYGIDEIIQHAEGVFLFKFKSDDVVQFIMENGP